MEQCLQQFGYEAATPAVFPVRSAMNAENWKKELKARLNQNVQAVVLLLPGQKGKCNLYDEVKKYLLTDIPVSS